jgi:hypothetical protein
MIHARKNIFRDNYIGVEITGSGTSSVSSPPRDTLDFGTAADAGENTFACNSHTGSPGLDVWVHLGSDSDAALPVRLAGNAWNHDGVTAATAITDGADLVMTSSTAIAPTADTSGQKPSQTMCTAPRVP